MSSLMNFESRCCTEFCLIDRMCARGAQNLTQALDNVKQAREKTELTLQHLDTAQQVLLRSLQSWHQAHALATSMSHHVTNPFVTSIGPCMPLHKIRPTQTPVLGFGLQNVNARRWMGGSGPVHGRTWTPSWQRWSAWRRPSPSSSRTGAPG